MSTLTPAEHDAWDLAEDLHERRVYALALQSCAGVAFTHARRELDVAERGLLAAMKRAEKARASVHRTACVYEDAARFVARAIDDERSASGSVSSSVSSSP